MTDLPIVMPGMLTDPIAMAWFFGVERVYPWQQNDILDILKQDKPFAGVYCNSAGKSGIVIPLFGLYVMSTYPGSQIVSTSGSWNQIETQLWPAVKNMTSRLPGWTWNKKELTGPVVEVDGIPLQSKWTPFSTDDPKRAEGHHNQLITGRTGQKIIIHKAYIIDEAKSVDDGIFDAMARCKVSWKAVLSSAGEDYGAFYRCFHDHAALWTTRQRSWEKCPHLYEDKQMRKVIEAEIKVKGRDHPLIKSQYFAEFFQGKGYRVFDADDVAAAMSGMVRKQGYDRCGAFDWSAGGDEQVWGVREGNMVVEPFKIWHEKDDTKVVQLLEAEISRWKLQDNEVVIDVGGGGKAIADMLERRGTKVLRYIAGAAPMDKVAYGNKVCEDAFEKVSRVLHNISIPQDDKLAQQLREREYIMPNNDSNRRRLVPKEELRRHGRESPDRLDCLIMLFSTWRPTSIKDMTEREIRKCPGIKDCLKDADENDVTNVGGGWRGDNFY